jgi:hypothetical protein
MVARLQTSADTCGQADEIADFDLDVRQVLFKTRHGRVYRALFLIEDDHVFILRVRGPGQAPVEPEDLR